MIKLFYDRNLRIEAEQYQLFPILEVLEWPNSSLKSHYEIVYDITECDFGIVPMNIQFLILQNKKKEVDAFIQDCQNQNKQVLVFSGGDFGFTMDNPNVIAIRLGGFNSKLNERTHMMPPFIDDPYERLEKSFQPLEKQDKPTVGFVGHANGSVVKFCKEFIIHAKGLLNKTVAKDVTDKQSFYPSSLKRYVYLNTMLKSKEIDCNFIFRKKYRAGVKTQAEKQKTTQEFYENIYNNLYTFCLRGAGNFSVRFYETLAMGRIPIVIDTDCRFPFFEKINWKEHCLLISESEDRNLNQKIIDFHTETSQEQLISMQQQNREIWKKYLAKNTYFIEFATYLEKLKNTL